MFCVFLLVAALLLLPQPAEAYIGPGAGFALVSSFFVVFATIVIALLSLLIWPFRMAWRFLRRKSQAKPWVNRLIIVGFDGQDPKLTEKFMKKGLLPNMQKLAKAGCYKKLGTTYPSISPVAWSSFATGSFATRPWSEPT